MKHTNIFMCIYFFSKCTDSIAFRYNAPLSCITVDRSTTDGLLPQSLFCMLLLLKLNYFQYFCRLAVVNNTTFFFLSKTKTHIHTPPQTFHFPKKKNQKNK